MRNKQLILRKLFEVNNFLNGQEALLSTNRSVEEIKAQIEKIKAKLHEVEVLVNGEQETF
ncbi:MAG: hypothetical protein ACK55Z_20550 [bacterium]|jgi:hypothetical protein